MQREYEQQEQDIAYRQARNKAIMQERARLGRELHDNLAQALGYLNIQISITDQLLSDGRVDDARANLKNLKDLASETYTDLREEIFSLRARVSSKAEFLVSLRDYLDKYRTHYDLEVNLSLDEAGPPEFAEDVAGQVLRIIQEALINVRKHAGVNEARIHFDQEGDRVRISIEDSGRGFELKKVNRKNGNGLGMQIMRERVKSIGGRLEIDSHPSRGSRFVIWAPAKSKTTGGDEYKHSIWEGLVEQA